MSDTPSIMNANSRELRVTSYLERFEHVQSNTTHAIIRMGEYTVRIPHGVPYSLSMSTTETDSLDLSVPLTEGLWYTCQRDSDGCLVQMHQDPVYPPTVPLDDLTLTREENTWEDFLQPSSICLTGSVEPVSPPVLPPLSLELSIPDLVKADMDESNLQPSTLVDLPPLDEIAEFPTDCIEVISSTEEGLTNLQSDEEEDDYQYDSCEEDYDWFEYIQDYDTFYDQ